MVNISVLGLILGVMLGVDLAVLGYALFLYKVQRLRVRYQIYDANLALKHHREICRLKKKKRRRKMKKMLWFTIYYVRLLFIERRRRLWVKIHALSKRHVKALNSKSDRILADARKV